MIHRQAQEQFNRLGFQLHHADDAFQALDLLAGNPGIALLVIDVALRGTDGLQLAEMARGIKPDVGLIMTSAAPWTGPSDLPHLRKPWQVLELETLVGRVLAGIWKPEDAS